MPRSDCSARTTGANGQLGTNYSIVRSNQLHSLLRKSNRLNHFLQRNLMRRMFELLLLQPSQIPHRPSFFTGKNAALLEHEGADLLAVNTESFDRRSPGADKIPHGFMILVRNPYSGKLASAQKLG